MLNFMRLLEQSAKQNKDKDSKEQTKALSKAVSNMANSVKYITACNKQLCKMLGIDVDDRAPKGEIEQ